MHKYYLAVPQAPTCPHPEAYRLPIDRNIPRVSRLSTGGGFSTKDSPNTPSYGFKLPSRSTDLPATSPVYYYPQYVPVVSLTPVVSFLHLRL